MRTEVKNQVTMLGNGVCAEVTRHGDAVRTWLWLGPTDVGVELRRVQQLKSADPDEWSKPGEDPQVVARESFLDLDAAITELVTRGVDTDSFDAVWKSSNPF